MIREGTVCGSCEVRGWMWVAGEEGCGRRPGWDAGGGRRGKVHEELGLLPVLGCGRREAGDNKGDGRQEAGYGRHEVGGQMAELVRQEAGEIEIKNRRQMA
jgi:hypothetical protein